MKRYDLIPGPTKVSPDVAEAYLINFSSPDIGPEFFELYENVTTKIATLLKVPESGSVVIQVGEGMLALWSALKSCISAGDKVFCIDNGLFGHGLIDMAKKTGAEVSSFSSPSDTMLKKEDIQKIETMIKDFSPKMLTMIHCETPCGTLNSLKEIGELCNKYGILFYVDAVSSAFGAELNISDCFIDLGLMGSQKCLNLPPDLSIVTVSKKAWKVIEETNYEGYDALKPFKEAVQKKYFPYTHHWRGVEALHRVLVKIEQEGYYNVLKRHNTIAELCRNLIQSMGLRLYSKEIEFCSPTVTAVYVPDGWSWSELDSELRKKGVFLGGNFGEFAGKVFRIGHMGAQADKELVEGALEILSQILRSKQK